MSSFFVEKVRSQKRDLKRRLTGREFGLYQKRESSRRAAPRRAPSVRALKSWEVGKHHHFHSKTNGGKVSHKGPQKGIWRTGSSARPKVKIIWRTGSPVRPKVEKCLHFRLKLMWLRSQKSEPKRRLTGGGSARVKKS